MARLGRLLAVALVAIAACAPHDGLEPATTVVCPEYEGTYSYVQNVVYRFRMGPDQHYEFYNQPGEGGKGNDIAACETNRQCHVRAWYQDSADGFAVTGDWKASGPSSASSHGWTVECRAR